MNRIYEWLKRGKLQQAGLILVALAVLAVGAAAWKWRVDSNRPVRLRFDKTLQADGTPLPTLNATYRDVPPDLLTYSPGQHSGPLRYVVEEAAARIGYAIKWKPEAFAKSMDEIAAGSIDIIPYAHFKTAEREKVARFSVSLGKVKTVANFLMHSEDAYPLRTLDDVNARIIGYRPGSYYFEEFESDSRLKKLGYPDDKQLVKAFIDHEVQIVVVNNKSATERALVAAGVNEKHFKYAEMAVERETDLFLLYSRVPQRQEIFNRLDQAILQMKSEGMIAEIYKSFEAEPPNAN